MKNQHSIARSFQLMAVGMVLLFLLGWLTTGRATAQSAGPLPLPDMLIYGTVTNTTGDPVESGTIKALLNGQTIATAEIGAINGTDYSYVLAAPIGMLKPGSTARGTGIALTGDALTFLVNDLPAYYQDPVTSLTVNELRIPSGAAGRGFVLNLSLPDAMRYLIGDVNANGARNAADAMLTLKYDIGLIIGVTSFPPGPNTVYLPLCDIVENGRCDSSDALRVLQCDVGLTTVACPMTTIPAVRGANAMTQLAATPATDATLRAADAASIGLRVEVAEATDAAGVEVRVLLNRGADRFGAAMFELQYDSALLTPTTCEANPGEAFSMAACNPAYAPGVVRFNAIAATGAADGATLVTLHFQRIGEIAGQTPNFTLTANDLIGVDSAGLDWSVETTDTSEAPDMQMQHWLFLPSVVNQFGQAALESGPEVNAAPTSEPTATPTEEPSPTVETTPTPEPTMTPTEAPSPTAEATPTPEPTVAPTEELSPMVETTPTLEPTVTPTEELSPTVETTPTLEPTVTPTEELSPTVETTPTPEPTMTPTEAPSPTATAEETMAPIEAPTAEPTAPPAEESTPTTPPESAALSPPQSQFSLYLPAVSSGVITTTVSAGDAPAIDDVAPAPEAEASRGIEAPIAALPSNGQSRSWLGFAARRLHRRRT
jgi:hypothetical protein